MEWHRTKCACTHGIWDGDIVASKAQTYDIGSWGVGNDTKHGCIEVFLLIRSGLVPFVVTHHGADRIFTETTLTTTVENRCSCVALWASTRGRRWTPGNIPAQSFKFPLVLSIFTVFSHRFPRFLTCFKFFQLFPHFSSDPRFSSFLLHVSHKRSANRRMRENAQAWEFASASLPISIFAHEEVK